MDILKWLNELLNYDEDNKQYIKVLEIKDERIPMEYFCNRLVMLTYIIKEFKDYYRKYYSVN